MTYSLSAAGLIVGLAAAGAAVAQPPQYSPPPQMPQTVAGTPMGPMSQISQMSQMSPMMGQATAMMNDPRMQAHMTEMMRGCERTMAQMQSMHHGERRTR